MRNVAVLYGNVKQRTSQLYIRTRGKKKCGATKYDSAAADMVHCCDEFSVLLVVLLSWYNVQCICKPKDCIDLKCYRLSTATHGETIYPGSTSFSKVKVTCHQTSDGGGWIIYVHRFDGSVAFDVRWAEFKNGFGEQGENKEFWLGNENVYQLVKSFKNGKAKFRFEGTLSNGTSGYITADDFSLENETDRYRLRFGKTADSAGGRIKGDLEYHRDAIFATRDKLPFRAYCMDRRKGGWWFKVCQNLYLTGLYTTNEFISNEGMFSWRLGRQNVGNQKKTRNLRTAYMMFRPLEIDRPCRNPCNLGTCKYMESSDSYSCQCLSTHCGPMCESNPCHNNGGCVYNSKTGKISCVCVGNFTGTYCNGTVAATTTAATATTTPTTTTTTAPTNATETTETTATRGTFLNVIGITSLLLLLAGIIICIIIVKKRRAREKKEKEETERQKLLAEQESSFFSSLF